MQQNGSSIVQVCPGHLKETGSVIMAVVVPGWVLYVPSYTLEITKTDTQKLVVGRLWLCFDIPTSRGYRLSILALWGSFLLPSILPDSLLNHLFSNSNLKNTNSPTVKHLRHPLHAHLWSRSSSQDPKVSSRPRALIECLPCTYNITTQSVYTSKPNFFNFCDGL
jgi:hypothetical protein